MRRSCARRRSCRPRGRRRALSASAAAPTPTPGDCASSPAQTTSTARWAGAREDMRAVYNAMDAGCCSSYGEGFPNAVAEAMSCGVPCVATDVGDLALLVGATGVIVPPFDPAALAAGMGGLLDRLEADADDCRRSARERIVSEFGAERLSERTSAALRSLVSGEPG